MFIYSFNEYMNHVKIHSLNYELVQKEVLRFKCT